jgi:hypothetical protein
MGVPMMKGLAKMRSVDVSRGEAPPGAFEARDDTTSYDTDFGLDEAGLYLKALKKSMPSERVKAQWDVFNAAWREKWETKLASFRARGWGDHLADLEAFQKEATRGIELARASHKAVYESMLNAFRAPWDARWTAKEAEWTQRGLTDPNHPERLAEKKALNEEMKEARVAFRQRWAEEKATLRTGQSSSTRPWLEEFLAFQKEQKDAKSALRKQLAASHTPGSLSFTPFTPPPVDPVVHNTRRWKHDGPWLPGMGAEDFVSFLNKQLAGRKKEFNDYLVEYVKNEIYATRRLAATRSGETAPMDVQEAEVWQEQREKAWRHITKSEIDAGIKALRKETAKDPLGSKLVSKLILPFLKLPAIRFRNTSYAEDASRNTVDQYQFDQDTAPLSTHPSAGLGYLRHKSYIANHPILGPQANPTPIPARVIQARRTGNTSELYARLGVGGFVANDSHRSTDSTIYRQINTVKDVETIDVDTPGGRKIMVQPHYGSVTNDGRIHIKLARATGAELIIARGEFEDTPPPRMGVDNDLRSLVSGSGRSGVKELDELSEQGKQMSEFLQRTKPQGHGQPPKGFPGMAEALRGN